jgi:chromosome segregation ATPase
MDKDARIRELEEDVKEHKRRAETARNLVQEIDEAIETNRSLIAELREKDDLLLGSLRKIQGFQPAALATIERNGFVFEDIGGQPGNWQHLAFSLYTDLCEIETISRSALENDG